MIIKTYLEIRYNKGINKSTQIPFISHIKINNNMSIKY